MNKTITIVTVAKDAEICEKTTRAFEERSDAEEYYIQVLKDQFSMICMLWEEKDFAYSIESGIEYYDDMTVEITDIPLVSSSLKEDKH